MTRQEKNKTKKNYRKAFILSYILMGFFVLSLVSVISTVFSPFKWIVLSGISSMFFLILSFVAIVFTLFWEKQIHTYRKNIKQQRVRNLLRIGIEAIQNQDWITSQHINRMLSYEHRIFLKGYLLASYRASNDVKLMNKADDILNGLYQNL